MADELIELLSNGITIRDQMIEEKEQINENLRNEISELQNFNNVLKEQLEYQGNCSMELLMCRQELEILHTQNHELLIELQRRGGLPSGYVRPLTPGFVIGGEPPAMSGNSDTPGSSTVSGSETTLKRRGRKGKKDQPSTSTEWE